MNSRRPPWLTPMKIAMGVSLLTFIAGRIIPYWGSLTKDSLHTIQVRGRGFTVFLTPEQYLWSDRLSTYGFAMICVSAVAFVLVAYFYFHFKRG
jgi:hypothetical protein